MDGSELDQSTYASSVLSATREALGSGFSWWGFQNDRFGGEAAIDSAGNIGDASKYRSNFYGVLKYGNMAGGPAPWNVARPWRDKLVVSAFLNADQSTLSGSIGPIPPNYYDWHGLELLNRPVVNSGTVLDQFNATVRNGIVEVAWPGYIPDDSEYAPEGFFDRIPLDGSGHYEIRSAPSLIITSLGPIYTPAAGQTRTTKLHVSGGESISVPHISNAVLNVEVDRLPFDREVQGMTYALADEEALTAWSSIALHDVVANGNGTTGAEVDAWARDVIHITGETHFEKGSEVHLWIEPAFPACGSSAYHIMQAPPGSQRLDQYTNSRLCKAKQVELSFELPEIEVLQDAGCTYALFISHGGPGSWQVFDGSGKLLWISTTHAERVQCGTTQFARGEYTVLWHSGSLRSAKRFIVP